MQYDNHINPFLKGLPLDSERRFQDTVLKCENRCLEELYHSCDLIARVTVQKIQEKRDVYLKLTRHNGRAGAHGTYNPKHNDRSFNLSNSEHIDPERAKGNIYWDCFHGFRSALAPQDPDNLAATFSDDVFYLRMMQRLFYSISVEIAWSVWYTKINPYMRFSQKGASKCLKSAKIARAVF